MVSIIYVPVTNWLRYDSVSAAVLGRLALAGVYGIVTAAALLAIISKAGRQATGPYRTLDSRSAQA